MRRYLNQLLWLWNRLNGDLAYQNYLNHYATHHPDTPVLNRKDFFAAETKRKWSGIKRCC